MIEVLLASSRIASRRLQVAISVSANPDVGPGRRNGKGSDSLDQAAVLDCLAPGPYVAKRSIMSLPRNSWFRIFHVPEAGGPRDFAWRLRDGGAPHPRDFTPRRSGTCHIPCSGQSLGIAK